MKKLSLFDRAALGLLAVCLLVMAGGLVWSVSQRDGAWQVETERSADPRENAQLWREGTQADGLLEGEIMDLNTASAADLERLPGIGAGRAQAIVDWRQANGGFDRVEDLTRVKGIGQATLEGIRPYVQVGQGN